MKKILFGFAIFSLGFVLGSQAATRTAADCSQSNVQAAIDASLAGDTVMVPAGVCTWSTAVLIQKPISFQGAGAEGAIRTTITNGTGGILVRVHLMNDLPVRVSGFRFDQHNTEAQNIIVITGLATHVRIDHCWFETGDWAIAWNPFLPAYGDATGPVYGVIDHCTFHNMKRAISPGDVRPTDRGKNDGATAWTEPLQPGSINNMVLEDNNFIYDSTYPTSSYTNGGDATIYCNPSGGSAVIRNNIFTGYNANYLDTHGDVSGQDSCKMYEVYQNTFTRGSYGGGGVSYIGNNRGGSWLVWGNIQNGYSGETYRLWNYCATNGHPVKNTYFWDNVISPGPFNVSSTAHNSACPSAAEPVLNQDYFLSRPQSGQVFYPYSPLTYPHPLVSGSNLSTTPHPADTNSDYLMSLNEATFYGACWKKAPDTSGGCPANATLDYAVRAGTLWNATANGQYQYNSAAPCPLCWEIKP